MQAVFKNVKYIITNKKSIISLAVLSSIHLRCREAVLGKVSYSFASSNIIIAGDF
jgi:hypothetical protein